MIRRPRTNTVLAVDPGNEQSAYLMMHRHKVTILEHGLIPNAELLRVLAARSFQAEVTLALEQIVGMGMAVGSEVFESCVWSGRFIQVWQPTPWVRIPRRWVKQHLCGHDRAKDANVRHAILDRFGGEMRAKGSAKNRGPLYGLKADEWAALAVALTYHESSDDFDHDGRWVPEDERPAAVEAAPVSSAPAGRLDFE